MTSNCIHPRIRAMAGVEQKRAFVVPQEELRERVFTSTIFPEILECVQDTLQTLTPQQAPILAPQSFEFVSSGKLAFLSRRHGTAESLLYMVLKDAGARQKVFRKQFPPERRASNMLADPVRFPHTVFLNQAYVQEELNRQKPNLSFAHLFGLHLVYSSLELWPRNESAESEEIKGLAFRQVKKLFDDLDANKRDFLQPENLTSGYEFWRGILTDPELVDIRVFGATILIYTKEKSGLRLQFSMNTEMNLFISKLLQHGLGEQFHRVFMGRFFSHLSAPDIGRVRVQLRESYQKYQEAQAKAISGNLSVFNEKRERARQFLQKLGFGKPQEMFVAFVNNQILPVYLAERAKKPELNGLLDAITS